MKTNYNHIFPEIVRKPGMDELELNNIKRLEIYLFKKYQLLNEEVKRNSQTYGVLSPQTRESVKKQIKWSDEFDSWLENKMHYKKYPLIIYSAIGEAA